MFLICIPTCQKVQEDKNNLLLGYIRSTEHALNVQKFLNVNANSQCLSKDGHENDHYLTHLILKNLMNTLLFRNFYGIAKVQLLTSVLMRFNIMLFLNTWQISIAAIIG